MKVIRSVENLFNLAAKDIDPNLLFDTYRNGGWQVFVKKKRKTFWGLFTTTVDYVVVLASDLSDIWGDPASVSINRFVNLEIRVIEK